jgi:hypothetical protein
VLCVHPVDPSPDVGYEAAQLESDVRRVLLPLMPEAFHPGIRRLAQLAQAARGPQGDLPRSAAQALPPVFPRLVESERWSPEELLLDAGDPGAKAGLPGWDVLRLLGGDIGDVFAVATSEELTTGEPLQLSGRYVKGGMWHATMLPRQSRPYWRLALVAAQGSTELVFAEGWPGPARLTFLDESGQARVEEWPAQNPWTALVQAFDDAVETWRSRTKAPSPGDTDQTSLTDETGRLGWLDAIRALELDDAARRSVERGRAYSLDFPEATEEASFKGAMTLVGCSLLWISLLLVILSAWLPQLGWAILPFFGIFLVMQLLRWVVPGGSAASAKSPRDLSSPTSGHESNSPSSISERN